MWKLLTIKIIGMCCKHELKKFPMWQGERENREGKENTKSKVYKIQVATTLNERKYHVLKTCINTNIKSQTYSTLEHLL